MYEIRVERLNQGAFSSFEYFVDLDCRSCPCDGETIVYSQESANITADFVTDSIAAISFGLGVTRVKPSLAILVNLADWNCDRLDLETVDPIWFAPTSNPMFQATMAPRFDYPSETQAFPDSSILVLSQSTLREDILDLRQKQPGDRLKHRTLLFLNADSVVIIDIAGEQVKLAVHWTSGQTDTLHVTFPRSIAEAMDVQRP